MVPATELTLVTIRFFF